jgi:high affinity Mn2+ porin
MMKRFFFLAVLVAISFSYPVENVETMKAVIKMKSEIDSLERKTARFDSTLLMLEMKIAETEYRIARVDSLPVDTVNRLHRQFGLPAIEKRDFTIGVGATMVLQGTNNPNGVSKNKKRVADAAYSANVTFEKKFTSAESRAFLRCKARGGQGLDDDVQVYSHVNYAALGSAGIQVGEAWYEQSFFNGKIHGTIGLLDPSAYFDNNKVAHDETMQFLSQMFVINPIIELPRDASGLFYAPGVLAQFEFINWLDIAAGIFDANADWQRIGDHLFGMAQITFSPRIFASHGNYRIYGWYNQNPHLQWGDTSVTGVISYGFGLSVDQQIGEMLTLFFRYGTHDPETYDIAALSQGPFSTLLTNSWSIGAQIGGKLWNRDDDAFGIAVGLAPLSDKFKQVNQKKQAATETHFEFYYKIQCFNKMAISPDFQYIVNPFGKDGAYNADDIPIFGIRSEVDF